MIVPQEANTMISLSHRKQLLLLGESDKKAHQEGICHRRGPFRPGKKKLYGPAANFVTSKFLIHGVFIQSTREKKTLPRPCE